MQAILTAITAAALLWHTVVGCGAHAHAGACACGHGVAGHGAGSLAHAHVDDRACGHAHDADDANGNHDDHGDAPHAPCRCHCQGQRCLAIPTATTWQPDAPDAVWDVLPPLALATGEEAAAARSCPGGGRSTSALALPVRAHLFYQILLI